ncbi:HAD family hydrolase [Isachenkonia alkalipeptolytica]|uniref:HAD family hydrolase n=1 Tax=Isachenkonia alkalipeptolytica TaxID=2565777 RepID=A0AA43XKN2_9CLOT|nr:HAD family hydrolase [Isachenkonia alkalipeptolytica]
MKIKGILLDKDGTIIEFEKTWHKVFQSIFQELEEGWKLPREKIRELQKISGFTPRGFEKESLIQYAPVEEILSRWMEVLNTSGGDHGEATGITKDALGKLMEKHSKGPDAKVVPLENTLETIQTFHRKGYILGLATADSRESTLHNLEALGIGSFFHFIGSDDGFFKGKPDPHMGETFCREFQLNPREVLYIGDSLTDMDFAENTGFHFIGIKGSHNEYERFMEKRYPVIENIGELEEELLAGD